MESGTINRFSMDENRSARRVKRRSCNSQICFAYLLSLVAVTLIVGGVYLSYICWNKMWLILAVIGIVVNLFGSCFYYTGTNRLFHSNEEHIYENRTRRRRYRTRGLSTDQLMPSAPPLNQSRSVSQLSLNMIPQYFSSNESEVISVANQSNSTSVTPLTTFSQIFSVNGQSYLILPLTGEPLTSSNSLPLQNLMVRMTEESKLQNSNPNDLRKTESKKIECESQSCQTDNFNDLKKSNNCYRDVQLQTLSRTQLDQIDSQVINSGPQTSRSVQMMQSTSAHNPNGFVIDIDSTDSSSQESQDNSLEPFGSEVSNVDTQTVVTLIDLNDDNNGSTSESNQRQDQFNTQISEIFSLNLVDINDDSSRVEEILENQEFNSFTNDNMNEEHIDDDMSVPPPSYEDVVDYSDAINDDQPIIVDYGTL